MVNLSEIDSTLVTINWMKQGEPIGKWFIEEIPITTDSHITLVFDQFLISYSDGTNDYYLGGNSQDSSARFFYMMLLIFQKVCFLQS